MYIVCTVVNCLICWHGQVPPAWDTDAYATMTWHWRSERLKRCGFNIYILTIAFAFGHGHAEWSNANEATILYFGSTLTTVLRACPFILPSTWHWRASFRFFKNFKFVWDVNPRNQGPHIRVATFSRNRNSVQYALIWYCRFELPRVRFSCTRDWHWSHVS